MERSIEESGGGPGRARKPVGGKRLGRGARGGKEKKDDEKKKKKRRVRNLKRRSKRIAWKKEQTKKTLLPQRGGSAGGMGTPKVSGSSFPGWKKEKSGRGVCHNSERRPKKICADSARKKNPKRSQRPVTPSKTRAKKSFPSQGADSRRSPTEKKKKKGKPEQTPPRHNPKKKKKKK